MTTKNRRAGYWVARILLFGVEGILIVAFLAAAGYALVGGLDNYLTRRQLLAKGEKLTLNELAPPPIPDEQNFFADPIWLKPAGHPSKPNEGKFWEELRAVPDAEEIKGLKAKYPDVHWRAALNKKGETRLEMAYSAWNYYAPHFVLNKEETAAFTLALLAPVDPVLKKIRQLAARPGVRLLPDYSDPDLIQAGGAPRYYSSVGQTLTLQAKAKLILGDRAGALADVLLTIKLSRQLAAEPLFLSLTERIWLLGMSTGNIQQGLESHAWTDSDLKAFEAALAPVDLFLQLPLVLRGQRCAFNQFVDSYHLEALYKENAPDGWSRVSYAVAAKAYSAVVVPEDRAYYNRIMQSAIESVEKAANRGFGASKIAEFPSDPFSALHQISPVFLPMLPDLAYGTARQQNRIAQTRIACALERFRLEKGAYPQSLAELVPAFLPALPVDPITMGSMRYQLTKPDEFRLWSIGWNETDEGGIENRGYGSGYHQKEGDWVWNRDPKRARN